MSTSDCLFCRIVAGEIPADVIHESERVIAFRDINPQAPTHVLIIPRTHVSTINDMTEDHSQDFAALFHAARLIAQSEGVADDGYRVVMNCNAGAGQSVYHVHLHLLAGRRLTWPPG